jgi:hypothetical protein
MIQRERNITRVPASIDERLRRAVDDIRNWISNTPRHDVYGQSTTIVQSTAGGADTTLFSQAIQAGSLAEAGDSIAFEVSCVYASNANNKRMRINFGSSTIWDSSALAINGGSTTVIGRIMRVSETAQRYHLAIHSGSASLLGLSFAGGTTENLANALNLSVIGNGTLLGDISGWMLSVGYIPRA